MREDRARAAIAALIYRWLHGRRTGAAAVPVVDDQPPEEPPEPLPVPVVVIFLNMLVGYDSNIVLLEPLK
jgi:hypothetical protein